MKKNFILRVALLASIVISNFALASSLIFQDKVIVTEVGKTFTLPVVIDPAGEKQYTARFTLVYSPTLLEVSSFTFAPDWIPLSQPKYDLIDNQSGELIKTAGYPSGFSSITKLGTITFRVKHIGWDIMTVGPRSFVLNDQNKSTLESRPRIIVTINEPGIPAIKLPTQQFPEIEQLPNLEIKPLPNLPAEKEVNLFDIISSPRLLGTRPLIFLLVIAPLIGVILGILMLVIFPRLRSFWFTWKSKNKKS